MSYILSLDELYKVIDAIASVFNPSIQVGAGEGEIDFIITAPSSEVAQKFKEVFEVTLKGFSVVKRIEVEGDEVRITVRTR